MPTDPPVTPLHHDLLRAAARRSDHRLTPPDRVLGGARKRLGEKLIAIGVAERVVGGEPIWDRSPSGGDSGLRLTDVGIALAGVQADEASEQEAGERGPAPASAPDEPRASTKIARVLVLLRQPDGADLQILTAATGWQPHTVRAALTGLRGKGHVIEARKRENDGRSVYRILPAAEPTSKPTQPASAASN
ncbi:hypothetical protein MEX01_40550 [Methylorubrum extorquens]|uniref:DUF3489 domain-containing protein n=1 Tax=Methylorubrum extorquens TaxID=408 RepID=UPI001174F972|nr:DUF3489 domain-containing protein [Methylorubrum extorquens]GEL43464.1 hypothetical protein MEX01_40550 [Methylorubrum extorquens]